MVFQHYHLFQNKRALENITEGLIVSQNMSKKEAEKVGEQFLARIGLLHKRMHFRVNYLAVSSSGLELPALLR